MRKPLIAGNWKMNTTVNEAKNLVQAILNQLDGTASVEKVLCPPFISLANVKELLKDNENYCDNIYFRYACEEYWSIRCEKKLS